MRPGSRTTELRDEKNLMHGYSPIDNKWWYSGHTTVKVFEYEASFKPKRFNKKGLREHGAREQFENWSATGQNVFTRRMKEMSITSTAVLERSKKMARRDGGDAGEFDPYLAELRALQLNAQLTGKQPSEVMQLVMDILPVSTCPPPALPGPLVPPGTPGATPGTSVPPETPGTTPVPSVPPVTPGATPVSPGATRDFNKLRKMLIPTLELGCVHPLNLALGCGDLVNDRLQIVQGKLRNDGSIQLQMCLPTLETIATNSTELLGPEGNLLETNVQIKRYETLVTWLYIRVFAELCRLVWPRHNTVSDIQLIGFIPSTGTSERQNLLKVSCNSELAARVFSAGRLADFNKPEFSITSFFRDELKGTFERRLVEKKGGAAKPHAVAEYEIVAEYENDVSDDDDDAPHAKRQRTDGGTDIDPTAPPPLDKQEARILSDNPFLMKHLRTHRDGDYVANPHRGGNDDDKIKKVIREWALETEAGKRFLAAADIRKTELTIDRVIPRNGAEFRGPNCVYNLYAMPFLSNSKFGDKWDDAKRCYVGAKAAELAEKALKDVKDKALSLWMEMAERQMDWNKFRVA